MQEYPLFFTLTHEINSPSYVARVVSRGRVLMAFEDGEWWCHGVDPGGITERGETPVAAWTAFKAAMGAVFADLSGDAAAFDDFKRLVNVFIADRDDTEASRWETARLKMRATSATAEDMPFKGLDRIAGNIALSVTVERLEAIVPAEKETIGLAFAEAA